MANLKAMAIGDKSINFESTLLAELKSKIDMVSADIGTINSFINEYKLAGGIGINNYSNVNQWILRHYTSEGLLITYRSGYSWYRIFPVIGNYVYCLKSYTGNQSNFYVILKQLVDISTPTKLNNFYRGTSTDYLMLTPIYDATLSEDSVLEEDEILLHVTTNGTFYKPGVITKMIKDGSNSCSPQEFAIDIKYGVDRMILYPDSKQNDIQYKFELVKAGKEENKYIQGLLVTPSAFTIDSPSNGNIAKKTGITLLNNGVNLGEVYNEFTWIDNVPQGSMNTWYINLNPLTVTQVYSS